MIKKIYFNSKRQLDKIFKDSEQLKYQEKENPRSSTILKRLP
jgi:hypothetical protein